MSDDQIKDQQILAILVMNEKIRAHHLIYRQYMNLSKATSHGKNSTNVENVEKYCQTSTVRQGT